MTIEDKDLSRTHEAVEEAAHSSTSDKLKGRAKETVGKAKEKIGSVVGDHELEGEGEAQRLEGKKDRAKGEIKEKIDEAKNKVKAGVEVVKEKIGEVRGKK